MRHLRFAAIALALFAVAGTAFAGSASHSPNAPKNLHGFLLRSNEPTTNEFPRTPAFAWSPVSGALCYEFELGTSKSFTQNTLIWSNVSYGVGAKPACRTTTSAPFASRRALLNASPPRESGVSFSVTRSGGRGSAGVSKPGSGVSRASTSGS